MADKAKLLLALEMLTSGEEAALPERLMSAAADAQERATPWLTEPGIQGYGIGPKIKDGEVLKEQVLKVYVERKEHKSELKNPVPGELKLPGLQGRVYTDVEAIGLVEKESNTGRLRPAVPGFSVGHPLVSAGTFGCLVRKRGQPDRFFILSNSHVLANQGIAAPGDDALQPGRFDGGVAPGDVIGKLVEWTPFQFGPGYPAANLDAAIAEVDRAQVSSIIHKIGVPQGVSRVRRINMQVQKTGRTTDYTVGVIRDVNYRFSLTYNQPGGGSGPVGFRDQTLCTRYTAPGDSGSAVLSMTGKVIGLHFAGSPSSSICHPIQAVLNALDLEVVTQPF